MKTEAESLFEAMELVRFDKVREVFIARSRIETERTHKSRSWMSSNGYEEIDIEDGRLLSDDGREIVFAHKKKWVLNKDEWERRRSLSLEEAAREKAAVDTKSVAGTDSLAVFSCPVCGDAFQKTKICPSCLAGRAGYSFRYSCVCGVDIVSKDDLCLTIANRSK